MTQPNSFDDFDAFRSKQKRISNSGAKPRKKGSKNSPSEIAHHSQPLWTLESPSSFPVQLAVHTEIQHDSPAALRRNVVRLRPKLLGLPCRHVSKRAGPFPIFSMYVR